MHRKSCHRDRLLGWLGRIRTAISACRHLLGRMIAMRIQEQAFGGLDRETLIFLNNLTRRVVSPSRHLKPGTVLDREYQGTRHTVTVVREGFAAWQATTYTSLLAIARVITGTAWSGPRQNFCVESRFSHHQAHGLIVHMFVEIALAGQERPRPRGAEHRPLVLNNQHVGSTTELFQRGVETF